MIVTHAYLVRASIKKQPKNVEKNLLSVALVYPVNN